MIVFKDRITGDELFSDSFKMSEVFDGLMYKVHCCMTVKSGDALDPSAFGLNPSAEEQEEQVEDCAQEKGLDICLFHKVEECPIIDSKKAVSSYLKKYLKNLAKHLQSDECYKDALASFKKNFQNPKDVMEKFTDLFDDNSSFYFGEHFDPGENNSAPMIGKWDEDGMGLDMYILKDSLEEEKC